MVKNKAYVEACIIEKISTFTLYYFEFYSRTIINCIPRNDGGGELPLSENLSIFCYPRQLLLKNVVVRSRYLTDIKFK
jgi:hypothetical protein